jgi:hypothetical protein
MKLVGSYRNGRYHLLKGLPRCEFPTAPVRLKLSDHARGELLDRHGVITPPSHVDFSQVRVEIVEVRNNIMRNVVIRTHYSDKLDLVMVINPTGLICTPLAQQERVAPTKF